MYRKNARYFCIGLIMLGTACVDGKIITDSIVPTEEQIDQDGDGFTVADGDCNDQNASVYPQAREICDSLDNNCNSYVDEESFVWSWSGTEADWSAGEGVAKVEVSIDRSAKGNSGRRFLA